MDRPPDVVPNPAQSHPSANANIASVSAPGGPSDGFPGGVLAMAGLAPDTARVAPVGAESHHSARDHHIASALVVAGPSADLPANGFPSASADHEGSSAGHNHGMASLRDGGRRGQQPRPRPASFLPNRSGLKLSRTDVGGALS